MRLTGRSGRSTTLDLDVGSRRWKRSRKAVGNRKPEEQVPPGAVYVRPSHKVGESLPD